MEISNRCKAHAYIPTVEIVRDALYDRTIRMFENNLMQYVRAIQNENTLDDQRVSYRRSLEQTQLRNRTVCLADIVREVLPSIMPPHQREQIVRSLQGQLRRLPISEVGLRYGYGNVSLLEDWLHAQAQEDGFVEMDRRGTEGSFLAATERLFVAHEFLAELESVSA